MSVKPRPNHRKYIEILRGMTPEQRLLKAFELTEAAREKRMRRLRRLFPHLQDGEIMWLLVPKLLQRAERERAIACGARRMCS